MGIFRQLSRKIHGPREWGNELMLRDLDFG